MLGVSAHDLMVSNYSNFTALHGKGKSTLAFAQFWCRLQSEGRGKVNTFNFVVLLT